MSEHLPYSNRLDHVQYIVHAPIIMEMMCKYTYTMVTKNEGGREGDNKSASVWHYGDQGLFEI